MSDKSRQSKTIMLQGTSSHVGKSLLCTALCRIFKQDGFYTAPFKAQNMALNSYVTLDGLEIGRAQGVQAEAAGVRAQARMNPVLLKPKADMAAQVVVMGKPYRDMSAREYRANFLPQAVGLVKKCIDELKQHFDVLVIERAGSPAEVNLKDKDIVNMKTAEMADSPVILVADIDRGGVFAALVGTLELLEPQERKRVAGFIINKFRGDITLLQPGLDFLEERTGVPVLGVIPYLHQHGIEQEDSVVLGEMPRTNKTGTDVDIAVVKLPRISNFTDLDPLTVLPGAKVRYIKPGEPLGNPDVIIIPGTKNSMLDLKQLWKSGTAKAIVESYQQGTHLVGICGGFQMLGQVLCDPESVEGEELCDIPGLNLLDMETIFKPGKIARQVTCQVVTDNGFWSELIGQQLTGYEIRSGHSVYRKDYISLLESDAGLVAVSSPCGGVWGTYLHGIFQNTQFTFSWYNYLRKLKGLTTLNREDMQFVNRDGRYRDLADQVRQHLDMKLLYQIMGVSYGD